MPYINTSTNIKITDEKREQLKARLGRAIENLGKSESWLMLGFDDEKPMYFKGESSSPMAFVAITPGTSTSNVASTVCPSPVTGSFAQAIARTDIAAAAKDFNNFLFIVLCVLKYYLSTYYDIVFSVEIGIDRHATSGILH